MSLASTYAAAINSAAATTAGIVPPPPFIGPVIQAACMPDGSMQLTVPSTGDVYHIPAAAAVGFANWIIATFV
jgi:hypothetical protein